MNHSQQLIDRATHPHRCYILSTFDLLSIEDLPSWWALAETYHGDSQGTWPIFPAETHAVRWETLLPRISIPIEIFTPYTCLVLENEERNYAFGLAYAFGWIKKRDNPSGSERSWVLEVPDYPPVTLATTKEGAPSLWQALVNYGLSNDGTVTHIKKLINQYMQADYESRRKILEQLEKKLGQVRNSQHGEAQIVRLLHLVLEDFIRRFENAHFQEKGDVLLKWTAIP